MEVKSLCSHSLFACVLTNMLYGSLLRRQPFKSIYYLYFIFALLLKVPIWCLTYYFRPSTRPRASWTWRRSVLSRILLAAGEAASVTGDYVRLRVDPERFRSCYGSGSRLVWVEPTPALILGQIKEFATINSVTPARVPGYWYSDDRPAVDGEKVIYGLHGESKCPCIFTRSLNSL